MAISRVTQSLLTDRSLTRLQGGLTRLSEIQEHLSTGRVLNRPSDNPADAGAAMRLRSARGAQQQYVRNAQDGRAWLDTLDATLATAGDVVRRARELAQQGANATAGPQARAALATEVDQIRAGLLSTANATYLDRPVLGGTTAGRVAFAEAGGVVTFSGDSNPVNRTVADGVGVDVALAGPAAFGADGDNVFDHLSALSTALRSGDVAGIRTGLDALKADGDRIVVARADVGARTVRVAQAALAATARVLQPSLVDFLR